MYYVYVLQSEKVGKFYIGSTSDLGKRLKQHNSGKNRSTRYGRPWKIVYSESAENRAIAFGREQQIKRYRSGEAFKKLIYGEVA